MDTIPYSIIKIITHSKPTDFGSSIDFGRIKHISLGKCIDALLKTLNTVLDHAARTCQVDAQETVTTVSIHGTVIKDQSCSPSQEPG